MFRNFTVPSLNRFPTTALGACDHSGAPDCEPLTKFKFLTRPNFYEFLNNRIFRKLSTDFENSGKRQSAIKPCGL